MRKEAGDQNEQEDFQHTACNMKSTIRVEVAAVPHSICLGLACYAVVFD